MVILRRITVEFMALVEGEMGIFAVWRLQCDEREIVVAWV